MSAYEEWLDQHGEEMGYTRDEIEHLLDLEEQQEEERHWERFGYTGPLPDERDDLGEFEGGAQAHHIRTGCGASSS